jgi:endoglucanase
MPEPQWPGGWQLGEFWGREELEKYYEPWVEIMRQGVGVFCGECGAFKKTPHGVCLAWMEDLMDILKVRGIGYALWQFRGAFGILDSGREDVEYEDFHGHKLDRKLLELIQKF